MIFFSDLKKARTALPEFEKALASEKETEESPGVVKQSPSANSAIDSAIINYWSEFSSLRSTNAQLLSVDDVAYFTTEITATKSNTNYYSNTYNSTTVTQTDIQRTATIYFNFNCNLPPLQIKDRDYLDDKVSRLEAMLPEKRK